MRILISSHGASPYGAERVLLILGRGLRDRGHDVVLEFPHDGPAVVEARAMDGVTVRVSDRPRLPRNLREAAAYLLASPFAAIRLARYIRSGDFDLVWVNSLLNPFAAIAAKLARVPVAWHIHERNLRSVAGPLGKAAVWVCADVPVGVSTFVAGSFGGLRRRFEVLVNADFRRLRPMAAAGQDAPFTVGYLGQLEPRKRVSDLLQALAAVPAAHGLIVGDGKRRGEVEAERAGLGLAPRVELTGFQRDVLPYLARMHCIVIPSRDEPCPLVAFEAMATGRPVVASDHGSHREILGDAALFFPLGDVAALASQLDRLRQDPDLRETLRRRALERINLYDPVRWLDQAERIAARLAAFSGRPAEPLLAESRP